MDDNRTNHYALSVLSPPEGSRYVGRLVAFEAEMPR